MKKIIFILILLYPVWVNAQGPAILPSDKAYNSTTWNGSTLAPTQNAVRDKVVAMESTLAPSLLTGWTSGAGTVAATDTVLEGMQKIDGNVDLKAPLASPALTGDATLTDATPTLTFQESDDTGTDGTGAINFQSSGAFDVIGSIYVDVAGSLTEFVQFDGVDETVDFLKPITGVGTALTALNGENIQDDTIDDDSIDFGNVTFGDFTNGAAISSIAGLSEADASIIETTADNTYAVVTSGGNNYMLGAKSDNSAIEFKAPTGSGSPVLGTSPTLTTSLLLNNALTIAPAAGTNGHTYVFQAYGSGGLVNWMTVTNDTGDAKPNISIVNADLSLPAVSAMTIADGGSLTFDESAADPNDAIVIMTHADGVLTLTSDDGADNDNDLKIDMESTNQEIGISSTDVTVMDFTDIAIMAQAEVQTTEDTTGTNTISTINQVYFIDDTDDEARDVDIADGFCNAAGDIGNWLVVKKVHSDDGVVSITSNDASNLFVLADDTPTTAGNELDMGAGCFQVCLMCLKAEQWYVTGYMGDAPTDGGVAD